jgi:hypothetical protein
MKTFKTFIEEISSSVEEKRGQMTQDQLARLKDRQAEIQKEREERAAQIRSDQEARDQERQERAKQADEERKQRQIDRLQQQVSGQ